MRDKYLEYGPGKDIDPEEVDEEIARGTYYGDSYALGKLANKLIDALQQREERKDRAIAILRNTAHSTSDHAEDEIYEALEILEGTDG